MAPRALKFFHDPGRLLIMCPVLFLSSALRGSRPVPRRLLPECFRFLAAACIMKRINPARTHKLLTASRPVRDRSTRRSSSRGRDTRREPWRDAPHSERLSNTRPASFAWALRRTPAHVEIHTNCYLFIRVLFFCFPFFLLAKRLLFVEANPMKDFCSGNS